MKRLRSDLSDTGDDTSSYEGAFGDSTAFALLASDADGEFDGTAAAIPEENPGRISRSFSGEETISTSLSNRGGRDSGRGGNDVPPTKRQKWWDHELATLTGDSEGLSSSVVPNGVSREASEDSGDSFVKASSDVMPVRKPEEIAMMDEDQLRKQVLMQIRLLEAMSKKIERLEREQGRTRESSGVGFTSSLPVSRVG